MATKRTRKTVGWYVDAHQKLKDERDELLEEVNAVKKEITTLEEKALEKFGKEGLEGARGENATGYIEERDHFNIADRRKFEQYIKRTGHMELFQGRVSAEAYRELLAQGKKPAGIGVFHKVSFRTRKR
jgi:hypothetical protein